jgi:phospholipid-binding lipoprotein MlaA
VGILGIFYVAREMGFETRHQDFGLTLAHWGYKNSTYIVLPLLGPRTIRDTMAFPVDYYLSIYPHISNDTVLYSLYGLSLIDARAKLLKIQDALESASIDKYVFMRNAYLQRRRYLVNHENLSQDDTTDSFTEEETNAPDKNDPFLRMNSPETIKPKKKTTKHAKHHRKNHLHIPYRVV